MNSVNIVGRLTRDPEMRTTSTGTNVCSFTLAVNKRIKPTDGSPDADFFNCVAWKNQAEFVSSYLSKGRLVAVTGRLQSRKYTASDGSTREVVEIVAENVQGLDRPKDEGPATTATPPIGVPEPDEFDPFSGD